MIDPRDMDHCREAIRTGSLSFHAASRLLPTAVRDPALALYAFCRMSDDAVDEGADKGAAVLALRDRLDMVYRGTPANAPADRAFAAVVAGHSRAGQYCGNGGRRSRNSNGLPVHSANSRGH